MTSSEQDALIALAQAHVPRRDDDVATWLKRTRDSYSGVERGWIVVDRLLERYRECADYGLTLRPDDDEQCDP